MIDFEVVMTDGLPIVHDGRVLRQPVTDTREILGEVHRRVRVMTDA
jgi:hypothetical protein